MAIKSEKALIARDLKRDVWQETLDAVRSIKAGHVGAVRHVPLSLASEARQKAGLSQKRFAELMGVSIRTLQDWEQGRRNPSGAAASLLQVASQRPDVLHEVFG
ncbi:MAG: helix-turn-helix domain-containing protein [Pseudomonadota bacterium]